MSRISPPKIVSTNQIPNPISADVAARRTSTDSSSPKASHSPTYTNVTAIQATSRTISSECRDDPEPEDAEAGDDPDDRHQHDPDDRQTGRELAVDHVVAIDRLGQEAWQRPLGAFAVDGIEREGQAEQRRHDGDERVDAQERVVLRTDREQREEDGRGRARLWRRRRG